MTQWIEVCAHQLNIEINIVIFLSFEVCVLALGGLKVVPASTKPIKVNENTFQTEFQYIEKTLEPPSSKIIL